MICFPLETYHSLAKDLEQQVVISVIINILCYFKAKSVCYIVVKMNYSDRLKPFTSGATKRKRNQLKDAANQEVVKKTRSIMEFTKPKVQVMI